jgi:hypothetical protein
LKWEQTRGSNPSKEEEEEGGGGGGGGDLWDCIKIK